MCLTCLEDSWELKRSTELNSGQSPVLPQKLSEDRDEVCFFWFSQFVCFFPKAVRSAGCPVEGGGLCWAAGCPAGPARPPRWLLPCRAVWFALWVKFLANYCSFLLHFHQRMGRGLPAVSGQIFWNRAQILGCFLGFFCCLVNTRLALIRPLCVVYLTPLWGDLLPGLWDRRISEPLRVW